MSIPPQFLPRSWLFPCLLCLASVFLGCGEKDTPPPPSAPPPCEGALQPCEGACVDLGSDPGHCGACGRPCAAGQRCRDGLCEDEAPAACAQEEERCGDACVTLAKDPRHCGACDRPCLEGERCVEGSCLPDCPEGQARCDGVCRNLGGDRDHCGACGASCGPTERCLAGSCQCEPWQEACGGACVSTSSDAAHCGACDRSCASGGNALGAFCKDGACHLICPEGFTDCDGMAENGCESERQADPENCGGCGLRCEATERVEQVACVLGACQVVRCEAGAADCNQDLADGCEVDIRDDVENCGRCGQSCGTANAVSSVCASGQCEIVCEAGFVQCSDDPAAGCDAFPETDLANCGSCGEVCAWHCEAGECREAVQIAAGEANSCALLDDGALLCWGSNERGQLGSLEPAERFSPGYVPGLPALVQISLGAEHGCGRSAEGAIWCWGRNEEGQVGNGEVSEAALPSLVLSDASWVSAGWQHTCAIRDGAIWCWGRGEEGQAGAGGSTPSPRKLEAPDERFVRVAAGHAHSCALSEDDKVFCWGKNEDGRLGVGDTVDRSIPSEVSDLPGPAAGVVTAETATCAWTRAGEAYCWGGRAYGLLGDGEPIPVVWQGEPPREEKPGPVIDLSGVEGMEAGKRHVCAITAQEILCWGAPGSNGQFGNAETVPRSRPGPFPNWPQVRSLGLGPRHSCLVSPAGVPLCWAANHGGQLGNGGKSNNNKPNPPLPVLRPAP